MKKPLFNKYERLCLKGVIPIPSYLNFGYTLAKFQQHIFKKAINPFC